MALINELRERVGVAAGIRQRLRSHTLLYSGLSICLNGTNRPGLELVLMGERNRIQARLAKQYRSMSVLPEVASQLASTALPEDAPVWTAWLQGYEFAPDVVKMCATSLKQAFPHRPVHFLDAENLASFVDLPEHIVAAWRDGVIPDAHFSDILRTAALVQHGGIWIDATVMVWDVPQDLASVLEKGQLFMYQNLRPGRSGEVFGMSSWLIVAPAGEPTLSATRDILYSYWRNHTSLVNYFLFHMIWQIVLDANPSVAKRIVKSPNVLPLMLLYELPEPEDSSTVAAIIERYPLQKLSHKLSDQAGTQLDYLLRTYAAHLR